jgi:hypothetical protein
MLLRRAKGDDEGGHDQRRAHTKPPAARGHHVHASDLGEAKSLRKARTPAISRRVRYIAFRAMAQA